MKNVMERLFKVAPRYISHFRPDCCILASRIVVDVLEFYKVPSQVLTVRAKVSNEALVNRIEKEGKEPKDVAQLTKWGEQDGSYSVGVGYGETEGKWSGHLVAIAEGKMLDLTLGQVYRPEWKIALEPVLTPVTKAFLAGKESLVLNVAGCKVEYKSFPEDKSYTASPDWQGNVRGIASGIIFSL